MKYALVPVFFAVVAVQLVLAQNGGHQPPSGDDHGKPRGPKPKLALHRFRRQSGSGGGHMGGKYNLEQMAKRYLKCNSSMVLDIDYRIFEPTNQAPPGYTPPPNQVYAPGAPPGNYAYPHGQPGYPAQGQYGGQPQGYQYQRPPGPQERQLQASTAVTTIPNHPSNTLLAVSVVMRAYTMCGF
ncbi:hypothetical protein CBL_03051 [Carabus blaptoides fortunei]